MIDTDLRFELKLEQPLHREYSMCVGDNSLYFRGHFPDHPVLPGVAQLEAIVLELTLRSWPDIGSLQRIRRLKFRRIVSPNSDLQLTLLRQKDTQVKFTLKLAKEQEDCCTGTLCFGERRDVG